MLVGRNHVSLVWNHLCSVRRPRGCPGDGPGPPRRWRSGLHARRGPRSASPGTVLCKDTRTGATTQHIAVGNTVVGSGGTGGTLSRHRGGVLVTNIAGGAVLFEEIAGRLVHPVRLQTGGEDSLSGALGERGAYVVTPTRVVFFPRGHIAAASSAHLLVGDGSAAQIALAGGHAYVSEKTGSLEAFALRADGNLDGAGLPVAGIPAGTIVGITGADDLVVSPVAHLASNANQATVPVSSGSTLVQQVETKEVAACWAASDDGEVCITNPGSMTVSCGHVGAGGFTSYTGRRGQPGRRVRARPSTCAMERSASSACTTARAC